MFITRRHTGETLILLGCKLIFAIPFHSLWDFFRATRGRALFLPSLVGRDYFHAGMVHGSWARTWLFPAQENMASLWPSSPSPTGRSSAAEQEARKAAGGPSSSPGCGSSTASARRPPLPPPPASPRRGTAAAPDLFLVPSPACFGCCLSRTQPCERATNLVRWSAGRAGEEQRCQRSERRERGRQRPSTAARGKAEEQAHIPSGGAAASWLALVFEFLLIWS